MPSAVRLRGLTKAEGRMLRARVRDLSLAARVHQRYRVIDEVHCGHSLREAADRVGCHVSMVYEWVKRFNASGFASFERPPNPKGRPRILTGAQIRELIDVALSSPAERGLPFSTWTVPKLAEYWRHKGLLPPITDEWVRRLLGGRAFGPSAFGRGRPRGIRPLIGKKRIRRRYQRCPPGAAVVCFDEWGPLELRPLGGGRLGATSVPPADAGHVPSPAGDRAVSGLL